MFFVNVENNVRCAVEDLNPRAQKTLLFVHGWPLARQIFEYQMNVIPGYNIRCISYDMRGYGDSDKPVHGYTYDRLADDLYRIIQSINCRDIVLCGFSMGGAVCARYMARYKCYKVCKLVLMGAACPVFTASENNPNAMTASQLDQLIDLTYTDRPALCDTFSRMCFANLPSVPFLGWFQDIALKAAGYSTEKGLNSLKEEDTTEDLKKITVPTAILHGVQDRVCPYVMAQQMEALLPNSFIIPFKNSGHCLFYDEQDKCTSTLIDFVNR